MSILRLTPRARPSVIVLDDQGVIVAAPEVAIATKQELAAAARAAAAAVLVCRGGCSSTVCRGHMPLQPLRGERIVLGRRGTPRAVYRITSTSIAGHIRLEREA